MWQCSECGNTLSREVVLPVYCKCGHIDRQGTAHCQHRAQFLTGVDCGCTGQQAIYACNLLGVDCMPRKLKPWASVKVLAETYAKGVEPNYCNLCEHNTEHAK